MGNTACKTIGIASGSTSGASVDKTDELLERAFAAIDANAGNGEISVDEMRAHLDTIYGKGALDDKAVLEIMAAADTSGTVYAPTVASIPNYVLGVEDYKATVRATPDMRGGGIKAVGGAVKSASAAVGSVVQASSEYIGLSTTGSRRHQAATRLQQHARALLAIRLVSVLEHKRTRAQLNVFQRMARDFGDFGALLAEQIKPPMLLNCTARPGRSPAAPDPPPAQRMSKKIPRTAFSCSAVDVIFQLQWTVYIGADSSVIYLWEIL